MSYPRPPTDLSPEGPPPPKCQTELRLSLLESIAHSLYLWCHKLVCPVGAQTKVQGLSRPGQLLDASCYPLANNISYDGLHIDWILKTCRFWIPEAGRRRSKGG